MGIFHYKGNGIVATSTAQTLQANGIKLESRLLHMDSYLSINQTAIYKEQSTKNRTDIQQKGIGYILSHQPHTKRWGSNWATREERTLIMSRKFESSLGMKFLPENTRKVATIILKNVKLTR